MTKMDRAAILRGLVMSAAAVIASGCVASDSAAFIPWFATFRSAEISSSLHGWDNVSGLTWNGRSMTTNDHHGTRVSGPGLVLEGQTAQLAVLILDPRTFEPVGRTEPDGKVLHPARSLNSFESYLPLALVKAGGERLVKGSAPFVFLGHEGEVSANGKNRVEIHLPYENPAGTVTIRLSYLFTLEDGFAIPSKIERRTLLPDGTFVDGQVIWRLGQLEPGRKLALDAGLEHTRFEPLAEKLAPWRKLPPEGDNLPFGMREAIDAARERSAEVAQFLRRHPEHYLASGLMWADLENTPVGARVYNWDLEISGKGETLRIVVKKTAPVAGAPQVAHYEVVEASVSGSAEVEFVDERPSMVSVADAFEVCLERNGESNEFRYRDVARRDELAYAGGVPVGFAAEYACGGGIGDPFAMDAYTAFFLAQGPTD